MRQRHIPQIQPDAQQAYDPDRHQERCFYSTAPPVVTPRAVILRNKRGRRVAEGVRNEPDEKIQLAAYGPGRDAVRAEGIDP